VALLHSVTVAAAASPAVAVPGVAAPPPPAAPAVAIAAAEPTNWRPAFAAVASAAAGALISMREPAALLMLAARRLGRSPRPGDSQPHHFVRPGLLLISNSRMQHLWQAEG